ncbi:hypothetical protein [Halomonas sp. E19]|uniref:hypothetical protein n=1 Tax=Halomonas sp. E19 TaxID=3397247 RepID=UPI00403339D8
MPEQLYSDSPMLKAAHPLITEAIPRLATSFSGDDMDRVMEPPCAEMPFKGVSLISGYLIWSLVPRVRINSI